MKSSIATGGRLRRQVRGAASAGGARVLGRVGLFMT